MFGEIVSNAVWYVVLTTSASLVAVLSYSFFQWSVGNRRFAVDYLIRNLWIPLVCAVIVTLAVNMYYVAQYMEGLGLVEPSTSVAEVIRLLSYDYAVERVSVALDSLKAFYANYVSAVTVSAIAIGIADFILFLLSAGASSLVNAVVPVAQVAIHALFAPAYVFSNLILFLTMMYYLLYVLKPISIAIFAFGCIMLPIPRVRRLGITLFIVGLLFTYGLPYVVNTSLEQIPIQDISKYLDEASVLYVEGPPNALLNFSVTNGGVSGYAVYQLDSDGKTLFIVPAGSYTLESITVAYSTYPLKNKVTVNVTAGIGKFFIYQEDAEAYIDELKNNIRERYGPAASLTPDEKQQLEEELRKVDESLIYDGAVYYVAYPHSYNYLDVNSIFEDLKSDDTYLMHNGRSQYTHAVEEYDGTANYTHTWNSTAHTYSIESDGSEYGELELYIITVSHYPQITVNRSSTKYTWCNISVRSYNSTIVFYGRGRRLNVTEVYGFYLTPKSWMQKIFDDFIVINNISLMRDIAWNLFQYTNWSANQVELDRDEVIEWLANYNNSNYEILIFAGEGRVGKEDMYALYQLLSNLNVNYDSEYRLYVIHIDMGVKKHIKKIYHRISLIGSYNITNTTIYVYWRGYSRSFPYDEIINIGNGTIIFKYENNTYVAQVNATATVDKKHKQIKIYWNGVRLEKKYDELINVTDEYVKYYTYKYVSEYISVAVDPTPTNWTLFPFTRINDALKTPLITTTYNNPNVLAMMNITGKLAYNMIFFILLLIVSDGIAAMFGGVSGIGYIGGKLWDKVFKTYIMQHLAFTAAVAQLARPPYGKWARTAFMRVERFRNWWNNLILNHGLLGHQKTLDIAKQMYGRSFKELTFGQKLTVLDHMLQDRTKGSIILKKMVLYPATFTSLVSRKLIHYFGLSVGMKGYIHMVRDLVGAVHIKKTTYHPRYTDTKLAKIYRALEKIEHFSTKQALARAIQALAEKIREMREEMERLLLKKEQFIMDIASLDVTQKKKLLPIFTSMHVKIQDTLFEKFVLNLNTDRLREVMETYRNVWSKAQRIPGTHLKTLPTEVLQSLSDRERANLNAANAYFAVIKVIRESRYKAVNLNNLVKAYNTLIEWKIVKKFSVDKMVWRALRRFISEEERKFRGEFRQFKTPPTALDAYRFCLVQSLRRIRDCKSHGEFDELEKQFNINNAVWEYMSKNRYSLAADERSLEAFKNYFINTAEIITHTKKPEEIKDKMHELHYKITIDLRHSKHDINMHQLFVQKDHAYTTYLKHKLEKEYKARGEALFYQG